METVAGHSRSDFTERCLLRGERSAANPSRRAASNETTVVRLTAPSSEPYEAGGAATMRSESSRGAPCWPPCLARSNRAMEEEVLTLAAVVVGLALCACVAAPLTGCLLVNKWRQSWEQRWRGMLHRLIGKAPVEPVKRKPEAKPTRPASPPPAVDWHDTPATAARDIATATAKWFAQRGALKAPLKSGYEIWLDGVSVGGSDGTRSRPRNPAALDGRAGWLDVTLHDDDAAAGDGGGGRGGGGHGDVAVAAGRTPSASLAPLPSPLPRIAPHSAARRRASPAEAPLSSRHRPAYVAAAAAAASEACAALDAAGGVEREAWQPHGRAPVNPAPDEGQPLSADDGGYCQPPAPPPSATSGAPSAPPPRAARRALAQDLLPSLLGGEGDAGTRHSAHHGAHPPLPAEAGALLCSNGGSCAALLPSRSALAAAARDTWSC